jgi:proteasome accessory factor C
MASELELLIEILPWLVANNGASANELATKFGISESKVLDLMQLLVLVGPDQGGGGLVDIDFEDADSLFVFDPQELDRPVQLSAFEASTLLGGLHYMQQLVESTEAAAIQSLISKISAKLPGSINPIAVVPDAQTQENLELIKNAIANRQVLNITYLSISSDSTSKRLIEPLALSTNDDQIYLSAWCRNTEDIRTFRLDRISEVSDNGESFEERNVGVQDDVLPQFECRMLVTARHYREMDSRYIVTATELASGDFELTVSVHSLHWLAGQVVAAGGAAIALEPNELRELVLAKASTWSH